MAEKRLLDDALVLRGGLNARTVVEERASDGFERTGQYAISCAADPTMTLEQLARANETQHASIRKSTAGRLRAVGLDVTWPRGPKRHSDLLFSGPITDEIFDALETAFDEPEPNPNRSV